jgi:hypothetical protein
MYRKQCLEPTLDISLAPYLDLNFLNELRLSRISESMTFNEK